MQSSLLHRAIAGLMLTALLALSGPATFVTATQVDPDDRCATPPPEPSFACVDAASDPDAAELIVWVMATDNGASIYLTDAGVARARDCDGAAEIVTIASRLYTGLPAGERLRDDLLWANPALTREVYAHAWAATLGSDRGNPVDIVFGDYAGDPDSFQSRVYRGPGLAMLCPG